MLILYFTSTVWDALATALALTAFRPVNPVLIVEEKRALGLVFARNPDPNSDILVARIIFETFVLHSTISYQKHKPASQTTP
jgi:hypothetical protein